MIITKPVFPLGEPRSHFWPTVPSVYIHCTLSHASSEKQSILDFLTLGSVLLVLGVRKATASVGPKGTFQKVWKDHSAAPIHSVSIPCTHSEACSSNRAHSNSSTALPRNSNHHWCGYRENVCWQLAAALQEELVSLISLPCVELHRQHDSWAKNQLLLSEGHVNPQSLLYCMQSVLLPWASCISLFLNNSLILSETTREACSRFSLPWLPSVSRLIEKDVPRLRVLGDIRRQPVEFFNSLCIYFFYNVVIKQ